VPVPALQYNRKGCHGRTDCRCRRTGATEEATEATAAETASLLRPFVDAAFRLGDAGSASRKESTMTTLTAIVRNGRRESPNPFDLRDGTEVQLWLLSMGDIPSGTEDDRPMSPEEIARTRAAMEKVEPLDLTDEERAAWEAERQARKQWEKAHFAQHADK